MTTDHQYTHKYTSLEPLTQVSLNNMTKFTEVKITVTSKKNIY